MSETLEQYNLLKSANLATFSRSLSRRWLVNVMPSIWPINGRLQSYFGNREDPFNGHQAFHAGIDITASTGTPIHATADGIVKSAGWYGGYGKLVVVDHGNGVETYYAHMSRVDVIPGQEVRMGQTVGGVGSTGRVTAPHLHYEVRRFGSPQNPYRYLQRPAVASLSGGSAKRDFGF
jgi:murein DD-endopeptidase MepM/ murein hydrolase activator NlpD